MFLLKNSKILKRQFARRTYKQSYHPIDFKDFYKHLTTGRYQFIGFYAQWFEDCEQFFETAEGYFEQRIDADIKLLKIDIDRFTYIAHDHNIQKIPSIVFLDDRKEVGRVEGEASEHQIFSFLEDCYEKAGLNGEVVQGGKDDNLNTKQSN